MSAQPFSGGTSSFLDALWLLIKIPLSGNGHLCEWKFHWPSFSTQQRKVPARFQVCSSFSGMHFRVTSPRPQRLKPNRFAVGNFRETFANNHFTFANSKKKLSRGLPTWHERSSQLKLFTRTFRSITVPENQELKISWSWLCLKILPRMTSPLKSPRGQGRPYLWTTRAPDMGQGKQRVVPIENNRRPVNQRETIRKWDVSQPKIAWNVCSILDLWTQEMIEMLESTCLHPQSTSEFVGMGRV